MPLDIFIYKNVGLNLSHSNKKCACEIYYTQIFNIFIHKCPNRYMYISISVRGFHTFPHKPTHTYALIPYCMTCAPVLNYLFAFRSVNRFALWISLTWIVFSKDKYAGTIYIYTYIYFCINFGITLTTLK